MQSSSQLSLELQNSLRLVHVALTERGRKGAEETPLENFYSAVNRCFMRSSPPKKLLKRDVEAFYSGSIGFEDFISLIENGLFPNGPGMHVFDIMDHCLQEYLAVDNRRATVDRYVDFGSVRQLWITFAKLDTFGKLGLPNAEINELLIRVATLSNMEGIPSNLASVASMELVSFLDFLNLLIDQVFLYTNKQIISKMVQNLYDGIVHALLMKGTLKKRGHFVKNWKDRFFVLTVDTLTYYETSEMSVQKGQITINTSANVCAISEQGKPVKSSSSRFRVTCGSTGTTTDCVANDVRLAMDWVHSIDLAILYHRVEGRNFLHRLCQARQFTGKLAVESPEDSGGDKQLGYLSPPASLSGGIPPSGAEIQRRPHAYEDVDVIDEFIDQHQQQKFVSKSTSHITATGGEEYATVDTTKARKKSSADGITAPPPPHGRQVEETPPVTPPHNQPEDTLPPPVAPRRKQSEELSTPPTFPERSKPPPPPLPAKEPKPNQGVTYIDIDFVNVVANNTTRQPPEASRRSRQDHSVEYTSVDAVAMAVANVSEQKSKQLDVSPQPVQRSPSPSRRPKLMKDVSKQSPKNSGQDGDYINVGLVNTPTPASPTHTSSQRPETKPQTEYVNVKAQGSEMAAKPMKEVPNRPLKKEPSKDGDYVGLGYNEGKPIIKSMQEVPDRPTQKASKDGDYIGINYNDGHPSVKPQRMADLTQSPSPRKQQSLDGNYVGLVSEGGHPSLKKVQSTPPTYDKDGYINIQYLPTATEKPRVPPPVKPYSSSKQQSSLATPPQAAPRNVGSRPKSSYELDQSHGLVLSSSEGRSKTDDYLDLIPAGSLSKDSSKRTTGGLTLAASSKESTRDYLLVVPDPSSDGKKLPPEKPAPYGATHTYVNQSSIPTETHGGPPPLPPKSRNP